MTKYYTLNEIVKSTDMVQRISTEYTYNILYSSYNIFNNKMGINIEVKYRTHEECSIVAYWSFCVEDISTELLIELGFFKSYRAYMDNYVLYEICEYYAHVEDDYSLLQHKLYRMYCDEVPEYK